jgi:hypothetical protein
VPSAIRTGNGEPRLHHRHPPPPEAPLPPQLPGADHLSIIHRRTAVSRLQTVTVTSPSRRERSMRADEPDGARDAAHGPVPVH